MAKVKTGFLKIGNTQASLMSSSGKTLHFSEKNLSALFRRLRSYDLVYFSSVVPAQTRKLKRLKGPWLREIRLRDIPLPTAYTKGLGVDRALNLYGALSLLKSRRSFVVVDLGTAVTVDVYSQRKGHLGGWISVGARLSAEVLASGTAQLKKVELKPTDFRRSLGRSTEQCLKVGQAQLLQAHCQRAFDVGRQHLGKSFELIITGGWSNCVKFKGARRMANLNLLALKKLYQEEV
jgi:pantothenate kinase type III